MKRKVPLTVGDHDNSSDQARQVMPTSNFVVMYLTNLTISVTLPFFCAPFEMYDEVEYW